MVYIAVNNHADLLTQMAQLGELPWLKSEEFACNLKMARPFFSKFKNQPRKGKNLF